MAETNPQRRMVMAFDSPTCLARVVLILLALVAAGGCVQRRITIRTTPPGALVYIDNHQIGVTPVSTDFIYYGTRSIRIVKDGYETLNVHHRFNPPWYQYTPLDFVTENLVPWEIRDERELHFTLAPQMIVPQQQFLDRADSLRLESRIPGAVTPEMAAPQPAPAPLFQPPGYSGPLRPQPTPH